MGSQQRMVEDEESKMSIATSIAVDSGVVKSCSMHEGFLFAGHMDFTKAYKMAALRNKRGDFGDLFESQGELTDMIKEIAEDNSYESKCTRCTYLLERD